MLEDGKKAWFLAENPHLVSSTSPEFNNEFTLKNGWKTILFFWVSAYF